MFKLEPAITEWRRQMLAHGITTPAPLDELELHLREEIEQLKASGLDEPAAFTQAVQQIGQPQPLKNEFNKIEIGFMKTILTSVIVLLTAIAVQLPGWLQLRNQLIMSDQWLSLWLLGLVMLMWSLESLRRIIQPKFTGREIRKIEWYSPKATLKTAAGAAVLLAGLAFISPAATQSTHEGLVKFDALCQLMFGLSLLMVGTLVMCFPYQRRAAKSTASGIA